MSKFETATHKRSNLKASSATQKKGRAAEDSALAFLLGQQLQLISRNFYCRFGEIDLIMQSANGTLIFCEVRARKSEAFGGALASITPAKQQKIIAAADYFLQHHPQFSALPCRFDVVVYQGAQLEWLQAAFTI